MLYFVESDYELIPSTAHSDNRALQIALMLSAYMKEAPTKFGASFDLEWAISKIKEAMEAPNQFIIVDYKVHHLVGVYWGAVGQMVHSPQLIGSDVGVYVKPCARGTGRGRVLITLAEKLYAQLGAIVVTAGTNSGIHHNEPAKHLYSALGYSEMGSTFFRHLI